MSPRRARAVSGKGLKDPSAALKKHLIDTAERLLDEQPALSITARDIARAADVSDGVLYNHFSSKNELLVAALVRRHEQILARLDEMMPEAGSGLVEANLLDFTTAALTMLKDMLPITTELRAEPGLLHQFMQAVHRRPFGPQRIRQPLVRYLTEEQSLGRIGSRVDPDAAATLLIGSTFMLAFQSLMTGKKPEVARKLPVVISTVMQGLSP